MKIRPVGAELFHPDRRTDITKLTVAFLNVSNALKTMSDRHHTNVINILIILMKSFLIYEPTVYASHISDTNSSTNPRKKCLYGNYGNQHSNWAPSRHTLFQLPRLRCDMSCLVYLPSTVQRRMISDCRMKALNRMSNKGGT
jgi:hypothetical protein